MNNLVALLSGALFALGLVVSGMTRPSKVIGFLDVGGSWDPSLALVMVGAIGVFSTAWHFLGKGSARPWLAERFHLPTRRDLDGRLVGGAALFGIGWGLAGYCPGPVLTSLGTLDPGLLVFAVGMAGGMVAFRVFETLATRPRRSAA